VGIRTTATDPKIALYDSTTGRAFGTVFEEAEEAESFLRYAYDVAEVDVAALNYAAFDGVLARWEVARPKDDDQFVLTRASDLKVGDVYRPCGRTDLFWREITQVMPNPEATPGQETWIWVASRGGDEHTVLDRDEQVDVRLLEKA
jgi:hypothetical protein